MERLVILIFVLLMFGGSYIVKFLRKRIRRRKARKRAERGPAWEARLAEEGGGGRELRRSKRKAMAPADRAAVASPASPPTDGAQRVSRLSRILTRDDIAGGETDEDDAVGTSVERTVTDGPAQVGAAPAVPMEGGSGAARSLSAMARIERLPKYKRAIVWSEILGSPKGAVW